MLGSRLHLPVAQQIQDIERYSSYCVVIRNLVLMASWLPSPFVAIAFTTDVILSDITNVFHIWSTLVG